MICRLSYADYQYEFDNIGSGRHPHATFLVDVEMTDGEWVPHAVDEAGLTKLQERGCGLTEMDMIGFGVEELAEMVASGEVDPADIDPL